MRASQVDPMPQSDLKWMGRLLSTAKTRTLQLARTALHEGRSVDTEDDRDEWLGIWRRRFGSDVRRMLDGDTPSTYVVDVKRVLEVIGRVINNMDNTNCNKRVHVI